MRRRFPFTTISSNRYQLHQRKGTHQQVSGLKEKCQGPRYPKQLPLEQGCGSGFLWIRIWIRISLDPDPVFKFLWIRIPVQFQPRFWNKKKLQKVL